MPQQCISVMQAELLKQNILPFSKGAVQADREAL